MKILVSGCSFTQWPDYPGGPTSCWPRHLRDLHPDWEIKSLAEAAAGNQYIAHSVVEELLQNPNKYDLVLVMWSGVSRLDYLTDITDDAWNQLFDSYGFYRRLPGNKLGYIFSGGQMGTWFKNPVAHKLFYEQYKVSSELSLATVNLMEMVKLKNFLDSKKMNYRFMSYVNYWQPDNVPSFNGDFSVAKYPELNLYINELDFSKFIFLNDNKDTVFDLAQSMNDFMGDGIHPGTNAHQAWAKFVSDQLSGL
jgi:hypothetical protein